MNLNEELYKLARSCMISYFGVADLSKVEHSAIDQAGTGIGNYPYCVTMGISLPKDIVDRLPYREQYNDALNYKHFAYDVINQRLDLAASMLASLIQEKGYRVLPVPASGTIDHDRIYGAFSHKLGARLCGFGWIGKNCLLITPQYGPRVRWVSVLTDAPLQPTGEGIMESRCGECTACADICPVNAIRGKTFSENEPREVRFDAHKCEAYFNSLTSAGKLYVCGMCLYACPHGRK
ncbi:MAG TPA: 4Fe-4S double cluster binding domain-containing protein [Bacillota bacterium]|nr:4Fe-4S double cluster binding domain-containing protein [Bacillota bacterium]HPW41048.1 4Fe-4S double cluster binding domain-containing protein [Bacillota bacterium]